MGLLFDPPLRMPNCSSQEFLQPDLGREIMNAYLTVRGNLEPIQVERLPGIVPRKQINIPECPAAVRWHMAVACFQQPGDERFEFGAAEALQ